MFNPAGKSAPFDAPGLDRQPAVHVRGPMQWLIGCIVLAVLGVVLGLVFRGLRFDDPFITYRYAQHLAARQGFTFNTGEAGPLITTAPLYALLLTLPATIGIDIPTASYWTGSLALILAAVLMVTLFWLAGRGLTGVIAGLVLLAFPLEWLTMGFETPLFTAVTLAAFVLVASKRWVWAGIVGGVALGLRGDGVIVMGLLALTAWVSAGADQANGANGADRLGVGLRRASGLKSALRVLAASMLTYAPLGLWLTAHFGSPLPTTLQTKSAQAMSGLTGFYAGTNFPQGAWLLIQAYLQQTPLFGLVLALAFLGMAWCIIKAASVLWRHTPVSAVSTPTIMPVLWAIAHFAGYSVIHVAPYPWYYAPMVPGLASLVALGMDGIGHMLRRRWPEWFLAPAISALTVITLIPLETGLASIGRVTSGATPPQPSEIAAKVLPEVKVDSYERVGRWIDAHTPPTATLGVTELGVMSYYARRHTVDFLGLTQPSQLGAIRHGDYLAGLLRTQPDYLALTNWNALYDSNPQDTDWFRALYSPATRFEDPRFWGTPMTVWRRTQAPVTESVMLAEGAFDLGDGWQVTGVAVSARTVLTRTPLIVRVRVKAPTAWSSVLSAPEKALHPDGSRALRVQPITVKRGDGLPPVSRPIHRQLFSAGDEVWLDFPLLPYPDARAGEYDISVRWDDGGQDVVMGRVTVP